MIEANTPVIVGVGQFMEAPETPGYAARGPVEIAAEAARAALADARATRPLAAEIDVVATTRTFHDSVPILASPFGTSNNFPRSIARRVDVVPRRAIWEDAGGNTPQDLVSEMSELLHAGGARMVLLAGAEAVSTARWLQARQRHADWSETVDGDVEDRLGDVSKMVSEAEIRHRVFSVPPIYALAEHARRGRLGLARAAYARTMGELFVPFTVVAAGNPYAAVRRAYSADELMEVTERNRMIADPYPRLVVARDQTNQGAAVLLTTTGAARALGIPEERWVYLHGYARAAERPLLERADLGGYPAAELSGKAALAASGIGVADVRFFDLYSCFPIAVSSVRDALGIAADDPRGLTVTGGLPFFGGPGNNYSMHAIASTVERLRAHPGTWGFVGANGGMLSKYSVGVYSTRPRSFTICGSGSVQAAVEARAAVVLTAQPRGRATLESFTVIHGKDGRPAVGVAVGRLPDGSRCMATTGKGDAATIAGLAGAADPLGAAIEVTPGGAAANRFVFAAR
ncbi:MAG: acetyl-CoA acetyltransferase [Deltaproteobacteria bacterium]|nr:acetyl-CoA acetyltransferase [Deltaproteobacteria bacterium]